jgi:hypothetical protein
LLLMSSVRLREEHGGDGRELGVHLHHCELFFALLLENARN